MCGDELCEKWNGDVELLFVCEGLLDVVQIGCVCCFVDWECVELVE